MSGHIVFAHANGIPGGSYQAVGEVLQAASYTWSAIDRLGHDPAYPPGPWRRLAEELIAHVQSTATTPVHLVGHSMGAVASFIAAWRRPELFQSLVMLDPPLIMGASSGLYAMAQWLGQIDRLTPAGRSVHRRRVWPDRDAARAYFASKPLYAGFDPASFAAFFEHAIERREDAQWHLRFDPDVEVELFRHTPYDWMCYWGRLKVPGFIVRGRQSLVTRRSYAQTLARRHGLSYREQAGAHMFPLEDSLACAQMLVELLAAAAH